MQLNIGIIGARGMVGSVLIERMQQENDLTNCHIRYYSTSQQGQKTVILGQDQVFHDALNLASLQQEDIIISAQGSQYTQKIHGPLREKGWNGYWIDAASHLRMHATSTIVLDPINAQAIQNALQQGRKDFIGSNCTVSLMLMAIAGLVKNNLVKNIQATTYQAISGAGASAITELYQQMHTTTTLAPQQQGITLANQVHHALQNNPNLLPQTHIQAPLAVNLLPWIDSEVEHGQSREEWKAMAETNRILQTEHNPIPIDSTCVRVPTLRCHSQALVIELHEALPLENMASLLTSANPWVDLIPNTRQASITELTPIHCANQLRIKVGRLRACNRGPNSIQLFTSGDQLLWGAAEPLRRTLRMIKTHLSTHPEHLRQKNKVHAKTPVEST